MSTLFFLNKITDRDNNHKDDLLMHIAEHYDLFGIIPAYDAGTLIPGNHLVFIYNNGRSLSLRSSKIVSVMTSGNVVIVETNNSIYHFRKVFMSTNQ